jgi:hypothetical protein
MELVLCHTFAHCTGTAHTTLYHLEQLINVIRTTPLLVLDDIDAAVHLGLLYQLAIRAHALSTVCLCELVRDERRGVQTRERDKLPAVPELAETLDVRFLLVAWHRRLPVERG